MRIEAIRSSNLAAVLRFALARSPSVAFAAFALAAGCGSGGGSGGQAKVTDDGGSSSEGASSSGSSSGSTGSPGSSSGSSSGSGSSGSGSGGSEAGVGGDATTAADSAAGEASAEASAPGGRQVLVWTPTYKSFSQSLKSVTTTTPKAFTEVSPDFYQMNSSTTPGLNGGPTFDGLSIAQVVTQVHAAGMKIIPLMYAGAGNDGTDQYIQDVLNDSPAGTQSSLISWLVTEAKTNQYDGWNLDWEVANTGYSAYGKKYISFLTAAKAALHAQNMILTIDVGDWYVRQCGGDGLIDLTQIGPAVDAAIIEDYAGGLGPPDPLSACPGGTPAASANCAPTNYFGAQLNVMCDVSPASSVSIGLINGQGGTGANPFLPMALDAIGAIGFTQVAVWPGENSFLSSANIPGGATWYSLLAKFLAQ